MGVEAAARASAAVLSFHGMRGAAAAAVSRNCNSATPPSTSAPSSSSIPSIRRRSAAAPSPPLRASSSRRRASSPSVVAMAAAASAPSAAEPTLKTYDAASMSTQDLLAFTARPRVDFDSILATVGPIVDDVRRRGDDAVRELTAKFDKAELGKDSPPCVPIAELLPALAKANLDREITDAFDVALSNIVKFHEAQKTADLTLETMPGVSCRRVTRPINRVGVYVPGGTAVLPSSALMLAAPARVAGCGTIVLATPPRPDGSVSPEVLYCAFKAGATHVLRAGGAQAVAALAYGTESTPKVDKILGPGNQYVTAAKMALQNSEAMVSIDMPAGPSEVLVIADAGAPLEHVAADLLSQAEHGPDSQVVLVALPGVDVEALIAVVVKQAEALPRGATAFKALDHSCVVKVRSKEEAASFSNRYAPEHLIVNVDDAESWLPLLDNAGSVFLGRWTPESVGDYASGTNHVLPTYGYARMYSGVSLDSFVKKMTVQSLSEQGLRNLGPSVATMARVEGLDAHERAVTLRLAALEGKK